MNWLEVLTDDLKQELETLLESSEGLKRLDNDLKEHCKIAQEFINNNSGVHDPKVLLKALELSFGAVAHGSDFFEEFDENGLSESLAMAVEDEAMAVEDERDALEGK
jgi:hypothetical protein